MRRGGHRPPRLHSWTLHAPMTPDRLAGPQSKGLILLQLATGACKEFQPTISSARDQGAVMWKFLTGFAALGIVIVVALVGSQYIPPPPPPPPPPPLRIVDHLCNFVRDEQRMTCVRVLASDTFMKPGAIAEYRASSDDKVTLPVADLFSTDLAGHASCLVPGVDVASMRSALSQPRDISI